MIQPVTMTRRTLLAAAAAAGLAGCGGADPRPDANRRHIAGDPRRLGLALAFEHTLVVAYEVVGELVRGRELRDVAEQEREHVTRLSQLMRDLGEPPREPRPRDDYLRSFPRLRTASEALHFAADLEERAVRTYLAYLPDLTDRELRREAARIATSEAEHLAVVRDLGGLPPAEHAFVTGTT
jgi:rubrerythrin